MYVNNELPDTSMSYCMAKVEKETLKIGKYKDNFIFALSV